MSLITRCPVCQTHFRVVPDQLRISEGWARCGSCDAIFDASVHLVTDTMQSDSPASHDTAPELPTADPVFNPSAEAAGASLLTIEPATTHPKRAVRHFVLIALILTLLLILSAQVLLHERDRIVAWQPSLRPWLSALCQPLKCQLSPLRRKEWITIDRASFSKIVGNSYRLTLTVRNTSSVPLEAPAIELTLTDTSDQPVLRRVLLPTELEYKSDTMEAGAEWSASLAVNVDLANTTQQTVGYRVYAFYP